MKVVLRPVAAADVEVAWRWYERRAPGLGEAFLVEVDAAISRITENPSLYPVIHRHTRRAGLHRFPYQLFCRVPSEAITVVACMHAMREPGIWRER